MAGKLYTTCKYAPEELFAGFSVLTERLDPNPVSFSCADGCAHPNLCGFAKAVIEEVHSRGIRELVLTDCCDAMRRTFDVLTGEKPDFLYFLPLPHRTEERQIARFAGQLRMLRDRYAEYSGETFSWEMALDACRRNEAGEESGGDYLSVLGAHGGVMLLEEVRRTFPDLDVRDDTCSGNRSFDASGEAYPESEEAFFPWYARRLLLGLKPCMRMYGTKERELLPDPNRRGIIYHTIKFCDYYSFEYADLRNRTEEPLLKIETDTTPQSSGQLRTRIEAFGETIGADLRSGEGEMRGEKMRAENAARSAQREWKYGGTRYVAGIDSGSTSTDAVVMDGQRHILGSAIVSTGMSASGSAAEALDIALREAGIARDALDVVIATGYGRDIIDIGMEKRTVTEITCHARGASYLFPGVRTIIDIGGQDSKVIVTDGEGAVTNFIMNDKCAAGTGRFLEMQARALGLSMEEMSRLGLSWKQEVQISSMCSVFAESEVVSLVAQDTAVSDIIHGLNESVAAKTASLVQRGKGAPDYAMTGGVSRNEGVVRCLEGKLGAPVQISDHSQLCGAIGAALIGL